jgi:hypothetical protein
MRCKRPCQAGLGVCNRHGGQSPRGKRISANVRLAAAVKQLQAKRAAYQKQWMADCEASGLPELAAELRAFTRALNRAEAAEARRRRASAS